MNENEKEVLSCLGMIAYFFMSLVGGAIVGGFVTVKLWGWFIAPLFALPSLSLPQAIGFSFALSYLTKYSDTNPTSEQDTMKLLYRGISRITIYPALILFIGWVIQQFL